MPWELIPGVGPGLNPIIKQVKDPGQSWMVVNEAIAELMENTDMPLHGPDSKITVVVGNAVWDDLDGPAKDHLRNVVRLLKSKYIKFISIFIFLFLIILFFALCTQLSAQSYGNRILAMYKSTDGYSDKNNPVGFKFMTL